MKLDLCGALRGVGLCKRGLLLHGAADELVLRGAHRAAHVEVDRAPLSLLNASPPHTIAPVGSDDAEREEGD